MECVAFEAAAIAAYPARAAWDLDAVDILVAVLARWRLSPGEAYGGGYAGTVLRVTTADGTPAVLKIGFPHEEAVAEAIALAAFSPGSAPAVLHQDPWAWAMLLERVEPGTPLSAARMPMGDALRGAGALLAGIWSTGPVQGIPMMRDVVQGHAATARSRRPRHLPLMHELGVVDLVDAAIDELDALCDDETGGQADVTARAAMVHGDFNPGNVLRSGSAWAAVDPKPMIGDPCYDLWPLVSQLGSPFGSHDPLSAITRSLAIVAEASGCDAARAARCGFARSGLNVTWYLQENNLELAARDAAELRVWAALRGRLTERSERI